MPDNNAAKSVHQYLLAENIHISLEEFTFQAKTHPDYPSVLAYSDTLHFFGITNKAVRLDNTQLDELPQQFMALLVDFDEQEMLAFVQRKNNGFHYTKNSKLLRLNPSQFEKEWKGIILLVEGKEELGVSKKASQHKNLALLIAGLLLLLTGLFWAKGLPAMAAMLLVITAAGLYLAVLAIKVELGTGEGKQPLFCSSMPRGDCNAVIGSAKGTLFTFIKISDACLVFFGAQLLAFLFFAAAGWMNVFYSVTLVALLAALPLTFYSIYVQVAIEKKWCALCLMITGLLYLQLFIVAQVPFTAFEQSSLPAWCVYIAFFAMALGSWLSIKALLAKRRALMEVHQKAIGFKRDYKLFRYLLLDGKSVDLATAQQAIVLGNTRAPLHLTLITNPFCGHCAGAHIILVQLLKTYGNKLSIAIRFNYTAVANNTQKELHHHLIQLYQQKGPTVFVDALGHWFEHRDYTKWTTKFGCANVQDEAAIGNLLAQQAAWNQARGLNFTPAFLIGPYLYPMVYEREDLLYFIPELIEDETLPFINA